MIWGRTVALVNARVVLPDGEADSIRFTTRVVSIGGPPHRGDTVIDVQGDAVLPGFINAHDHLELNHYGRLKFRDRYQNATEWIDDMRPQLSEDPAIVEARRHPLTERLFIGAVKNLLAGVTTVAHHNPYYRELRRTMPIRVVRRYGWAHSFALERQPAGARGEPGGEVGLRWRRTSADVPFFVHLAEGIDDDAAAELRRLEMLGCLAANTVLVHGVAVDHEGWHRVATAGAGLVWCPSSNMFLFGRTASVRGLIDRVGAGSGQIALGTDSRLTGAGDLLDELRAAAETRCVSAPELLAMITSGAAALLRTPRAGTIAVDSPADLVVVPLNGDAPANAVLRATRRDVRLVAVEGAPLVADTAFAPIFRARGSVPRPLVIDSIPRLADSALTRRIAGCPIKEPGVVAA